VGLLLVEVVEVCEEASNVVPSLIEEGGEVGEIGTKSVFPLTEAYFLSNSRQPECATERIISCYFSYVENA
jgi:hypothetical protein